MSVNDAMFACVQQECPKGLVFCLKNGANPNIRKKYPNDYSAAKTVLSLACEENDSTDCVKLLLTAGADPNIPNSNMDYPLHEIAGRWHYGVAPEMARLLLGCGAKVNVLNKEKATPLHNATGCKNIELCAVLVANGADKTIKNKHGETPLDKAYDLRVRISIEPEIVINPVCRQCHLSGKAPDKCAKKQTIERQWVRKAPECCQFKLELLMQKGEKKHLCEACKAVIEGDHACESVNTSE